MIKWNSIKGYVLVVISGLFFVAAGILIVSNIKNPFNLSFYWTILYSKSVGVVMLISAGVGVVAVWMFKLLVRGVRDIRRGRRETKIDRIGQVEKARGESQPT